MLHGFSYFLASFRNVNYFSLSELVYVCFVELESFNFLFRPDGIGTITSDEKTWFEEIKVRLWNLLAYQITHYR